ncbi:PWWP domain-containing protein 2A-like isoform X2 [Sitophilus oryzae]|uniref:PWWP domain-containing protein 2A-like isoform X2 n=1 Tax=Sitophilus oryzae TaxID=7048 RepID=A0A6J2XWL9_SITOR|nr:PWWP domain-containing protein 2A-like isoform X2 [Sitophilus oryzae]
MADQNGDITLLKKTRISVFVDEAFPDILVVTYEFGLKIFKGVLLDSTKRNLPCGVPFINPAFKTTTKNPDDDPLYAVSQRFAYNDPNAPKKKSVQVPNKYKNKNSKMTVRLRPRQVLCSKCKGICNENSENVSRKRKNSETASSPPPPPPSSRRASNAPMTRSVKNYLSAKRKLKRNSQSDSDEVCKKNSKKSVVEDKEIDNPNWIDTDSLSIKKPLMNMNSENEPQEDPLLIKHSEEHSQEESDLAVEEQAVFQQPTQTQVLRAARRTRKKKCTNATDEDSNTLATTSDQPSSVVSGSVVPSTRTIKISYGPQGEGTVLKIPAQIDNITDDDSEENINITGRVNVPNTKAARKAMKRAKKEARRKVLLGGSPLYLGGASPRYLTSPAASPRYTLGGSSPRYTVGGTSPRQGLVPRRRKHKMKHKKKHKEDKEKKHKEGEVSSSTQDETKEQCITQKLSINLKRLNNTYTSSATQDESASSSDEHISDFPPPNPPLMLRMNAQELPSALGADGVRFFVGDVVWGKLRGFPWWPGKILTITNGNSRGPQAHVAWYGTSNSCLVQCDQLSHYLDNFKVYYNKKRKDFYKDAIKQATTEARENAENRVRQPLGNSPSHNIIPQVVPPALASPREIDVMS